MLSLLTIPVAVGAIVMGPASGAILGGAFGLTSFFNAVRGGGGMTSIFFTLNPLGTFLLCFGARLAMGWLCGLVYRAGPAAVAPAPALVLCHRRSGGPTAQHPVVHGAAGAPVLPNPTMSRALWPRWAPPTPSSSWWGWVGVQGLVEALLGCLVGAAVTAPMLRVVER